MDDALNLNLSLVTVVCNTPLEQFVMAFGPLRWVPMMLMLGIKMAMSQKQVVPLHPLAVVAQPAMAVKNLICVRPVFKCWRLDLVQGIGWERRKD